MNDLSRDAQVQDVIAAIEALGRGAVLLIGQSMGGLTALLVAARRPDLVYRLIVIESISYSGGTGKPWLSRWPLPFKDLEAARTFFISQKVDPDVWIDVLQKRQDGYWPEFSPEDMKAAGADIEAGYDYRDECSLIRCPSLIVGGDQSPMDQRIMKETASNIVGASYACVQGASHDVHLDAPEGLRAVVEDFLRLDT